MKKLLLVIAALALIVAACGGSDDSGDLAENILESQDGVNDVDVDSDTGEVSIETDDGSISIGGGDLPDALEIDVPDGGKVLASFTSDDSVSVTLEYADADFDDVVAFYDSWTTVQGGEWQTNSSSFTTDDGVEIQSNGWFLGTQAITVSVCPVSSGDGGTATCVSLIQD